MRYFCSFCKCTITKKEFEWSTDKFKKALCRKHQETSFSVKKTPSKRVTTTYTKKVVFNGGKSTMTPEAIKLGNALLERKVPVTFEHFDGYKTVDLAILSAWVYIEVDGSQHTNNTKQALADLKRTYYSFKKGFLTLHIPNALVKSQKVLEETADFITKFLNESIKNSK